MKNIQCSGMLYGEHITVKQISKVEAKKMFNAGADVYLQSSNMMPFGIWQSLMVVSNKDQIDTTVDPFEYLCTSYKWYNCDSERGKYIHFYKKL